MHTVTLRLMGQKVVVKVSADREEDQKTIITRAVTMAVRELYSDLYLAEVESEAA